MLFRSTVMKDRDIGIWVLVGQVVASDGALLVVTADRAKDIREAGFRDLGVRGCR